jgi:DNA-binding transcriptional LysR family regulator
MVQVDLADLDTFAAVASARSFRGAAARRGVSPSSLSEAVRRLEARLGVRLLNRTTRSVTPTEAGLGLLARLRPALDEVSSALDDLNLYRDSPTGTLRLNVPGIVARIVLPPIAARFLSEYPGIRLEVVADDSFVDVFAAGFDAGVRYDERLEQDMIAIPLGPRRQSFVTAAAPAYLPPSATCSRAGSRRSGNSSATARRSRSPRRARCCPPASTWSWRPPWPGLGSSTASTPSSSL